MIDSRDRLLKGRILVKEVPPSIEGRRAWIEIQVHDEDVPDYPLRKPPYAMISESPFTYKANSKCRFQVRRSSFDADEIRLGYDPSYDDVGEYRIIESLDCLIEHLESQGVSIDEFIDSTDSDYPL